MTTTTREDLVRWIEAGAAQGFDAMLASSNPEQAPVYFTQEEDGSAALDDHIVRLYAGAGHVSVIGLHGGRDEQIDRFLASCEPPLPLPEMSPEESKAYIRGIFDEFDAVFKGYDARHAGLRQASGDDPDR